MLLITIKNTVPTCLQHVDGASRSFLRPDLAGVPFSKIHLWNMTSYERVLFIDADAFVTRNVGFLFDLLENLRLNGVAETNGQVKTGLFGTRPDAQTFQLLVDGLARRDAVQFTNNEQGYISKMLEHDWQKVEPTARMSSEHHLCAGACRLKGDFARVTGTPRPTTPHCGTCRCGRLPWWTFRFWPLHLSFFC